MYLEFFGHNWLRSKSALSALLDHDILCKDVTIKNFSALALPWNQLSSRDQALLQAHGFGDWFMPTALIKTPGSFLNGSSVRLTEKEVDLALDFLGPNIHELITVYRSDKQNNEFPLTAISLKPAFQPTEPAPICKSTLLRQFQNAAVKYRIILALARTSS